MQTVFLELQLLLCNLLLALAGLTQLSTTMFATLLFFTLPMFSGKIIFHQKFNENVCSWNLESIRHTHFAKAVCSSIMVCLLSYCINGRCKLHPSNIYMRLAVYQYHLKCSEDVIMLTNVIVSHYMLHSSTGLCKPVSV